MFSVIRIFVSPWRSAGMAGCRQRCQCLPCGTVARSSELCMGRQIDNPPQSLKKRKDKRYIRSTFGPCERCDIGHLYRELQLLIVVHLNIWRRLNVRSCLLQTLPRCLSVLTHTRSARSPPEHGHGLVWRQICTSSSCPSWHSGFPAAHGLSFRLHRCSCLARSSPCSHYPPPCKQSGCPACYYPVLVLYNQGSWYN